MFTTHQIIKSGYSRKVGLGGRLRWFGALLYILLYCFIFSNRSTYYLFTDGSVIKNLPAMQETQETWVWSLDQEDPMEEEITTYSSILAWKIPWIEEPGELQSMRSQRVRYEWVAEHTIVLDVALVNISKHLSKFIPRNYRTPVWRT